MRSCSHSLHRSSPPSFCGIYLVQYLSNCPLPLLVCCTTPQSALTVARVGMGLEALDVMQARSWVSWVGLVANPVLC